MSQPAAAQGPELLRTVLIVGAGLMGTSVGLALRARGVDVYLSDRDSSAVALAADLGAGSLSEPESEPDLVVLAVPPAKVAGVLIAFQRRYLRATFSDITSVKSLPQAEAETLNADLSRFVGGHPLAGRERSGAGAARADLCIGRPWVLTPTPASSALSLQRVEELVRLCGGDLVVMTPARHDEAVALISHLPQLMASLTAARLRGAAEDMVVLAGQGVRDVTRIAASDPALWTEILSANASAVLPLLDEIAADLDRLRTALTNDKSTERQLDQSIKDSKSSVLNAVLRAGNEGRERIPGKHGAPRTEYTAVPVVIPDAPGSLASLFAAAGDAGVNVEDVSIEHSPGQPVGLVELFVRPESAGTLAQALRSSGWTVHFGADADRPT